VGSWGGVGVGEAGLSSGSRKLSHSLFVVIHLQGEQVGLPDMQFQVPLQHYFT
jgi:hypothetical protein